MHLLSFQSSGKKKQPNLVQNVNGPICNGCQSNYRSIDFYYVCSRSIISMLQKKIVFELTTSQHVGGGEQEEKEEEENEELGVFSVDLSLNLFRFLFSSLCFFCFNLYFFLIVIIHLYFHFLLFPQNNILTQSLFFCSP